jgi:hypothetical protein
VPLRLAGPPIENASAPFSFPVAPPGSTLRPPGWAWSPFRGPGRNLNGRTPRSRGRDQILNGRTRRLKGQRRIFNGRRRTIIGQGRRLSGQSRIFSGRKPPAGNSWRPGKGRRRRVVRELSWPGGNSWPELCLFYIPQSRS